MKGKNTLKNTIVVTVFVLAAACSSDDGDPPPALDCNVSGPSVTLTPSPSICGQDDGEIALAIVGGTGNLTINIEPQPVGLEFASNTFTSLEPGT